MMRVLIALGANSSVGVAANARRVAHAIGQMPGRVMRQSRSYRTPAWPLGAGPDFVNAAIVLETGHAPAVLLDRLHGIEARAGRRRDKRWGARILDLDLLAYGAAIRPDCATLRKWMELAVDRQAEIAPDRMILPHPRLQDRPFVLIPLADVAPDWRHPVTGRTVRSMVAALSAQKRREIRPIGPACGVVNRKDRT